MSKRYSVVPTNSEIDEVLNKANAWEERGATGLFGMTYEQGVKAGIDWILGDCADEPIEAESPQD